MDLPVIYKDLSPAERREAREEYIKQQEGLCYYCKTPLRRRAPSHISNRRYPSGVFPPNFFKWAVHLHHDHDTGYTIGAVHCHCNAYLWVEEGE